MGAKQSADSSGPSRRYDSRKGVRDGVDAHAYPGKDRSYVRPELAIEIRHTINVGRALIISIVPSLRVLATEVAVGL